MANPIKLSEQILVGRTGRVTLTDEDLAALMASSDIATSGGQGSVNDQCTNSGDCSGTLNTAQCTNTTFCEGSLNAAGQCKSPNEVPGG